PRGAGSMAAPVSIGALGVIGPDKMRVDYRGSLSGFLSQTAAYFDIGWSYQDGRLQFSRQVTRTFQLAAMPSTVTGNASMTAGLSGGGSDGGSDGGVTAGASQTATVAVKMDFWKELQGSLEAVVGDHGRFTASPSNGTVSVTAPASVVERVGREVYELNKQLLRQVTLKIEVYNVALTKNSDWQFDLAGVLNTGAGSYSFGNATNPTLGINGGISGQVMGDGKFTGSQAMLSLLEEQGDVSVVNTASLTTMSSQPVPLQVSNTQNYLESLTQSTSDTGKTTTTPNVGTVNSGFSLTMLPKIMDDGKVLLQYSMNLSTLVGEKAGFNSYKYMDQELLLPNLDQRSFIQSGLIQNGATLVLAGYEKISNSTNDKGQGSASFKGLGGTQGGKQIREMLVVMITPVVLDHTAELARLN
ncbi:MAG: secretin N-terminal domain-containing protein, partial [Pseudomonas sp.]|uniref:secretin N-terminal domain-containing protein n=1 Tax=Pseudomonas sp. TaxID=306 RepID=UPI003BB57C25